MSALNLVVYSGRRTHQHYLAAQIELEALRARVVELEAVHIYLDESPVNPPDSDEDLSLADRVAAIVNELIAVRSRVAEFEAENTALARDAAR